MLLKNGVAECVASEVNDFIPGGSSNTGTIIIVVIVLLALIAIIAGALIFYSKKNDLWCFAPEESTNTKVETIWFHF